MSTFCRSRDYQDTIKALRLRVAELEREKMCLLLENAELVRQNLQREHALAAVIRPEVAEHDSRLGVVDSE
jgi:hypothetical protein